MSRILRSVVAITLWGLAVVLPLMGYNPLEAALYGTIGVFVHPATSRFLLNNARRFAGLAASDLADAAQRGDLSALRAGINQGANLDRTERGFPLIVAIIAGQTEAAAMLIEAGANIQLKDNVGRTPLFAAAFKNRIETARLLLSRRAEVNVVEQNGATPLHMAAHEGFVEFADLLLKNGAQVDPTDRHGDTPLYVAAFEGHLAVVNLLLGAGANVNTQDARGRSPLLAAVFKNRADIVRPLLERGANVLAIDSEGLSVLQRAKQIPAKAEIIEMLTARAGSA